MAPPGRSPGPWRRRAAGAAEIRFRDVTFAYPGTATPVLDGLRPHDPGRHVAGDRRGERRRQDHAGQAAVPAVRPAGRADRGRRDRRSRDLEPTRGGAHVTAVFQDFVRFELPLRDNVAPAERPTT